MWKALCIIIENFFVSKALKVRTEVKGEYRNLGKACGSCLQSSRKRQTEGLEFLGTLSYWETKDCLVLFETYLGMLLSKKRCWLVERCCQKRGFSSEESAWPHLEFCRTLLGWAFQFCSISDWTRYLSSSTSWCASSLAPRSYRASCILCRSSRI